MNSRPVLLLTGLALAAFATPGISQVVVPDSIIPVISARKYVSGSITVKVTGSLQINQAVAINTIASVSDGQMTWLQFGASGSAAPNATITYGQDIADGVGIVVAKGKVSATAGSELCTGTLTVTGTLLTGKYTCTGVTSWDSSSFHMGQVTIDISFTAQS